MKLEEGMYVRTKWGIARFIHNLVTKATIYRVIDKKIVYDNVKHWEDCLLDNEIIKASHNIIDLIEVGDVITTNNLCGEVTKIDIENNKIWIACCDYETCRIEDVKSIVTKEQMESMSYKVGE